jgi:hypothetical protein
LSGAEFAVLIVVADILFHVVTAWFGVKLCRACHQAISKWRNTSGT